jgi:hypothetical protein
VVNCERAGRKTWLIEFCFSKPITDELKHTSRWDGFFFSIDADRWHPGIQKKNKFGKLMPLGFITF